MRLNCAGITDIGSTRDHNEDDFYLSHGNEVLCVVADGMGGHQSGEVASAIAIRAIVEYFRETMQDEDGLDELNQMVSDGVLTCPVHQYRLIQALRIANHAVFQAANSSRSYQGMGTTVVSCYFHQDSVFFAHIGDSRAYRYRDGLFERQTEDHSLANEYLRSGLLTAETVKTFPYKNVITRACGLGSDVEVEANERKMLPGDLYLLCSDGLSDMVPDDEIIELLEAYSELDNLCEKLVERANANGGVDNITVIVARVEES